jgi:AraC-like DNA-binding protein
MLWARPVGEYAQKFTRLAQSSETRNPARRGRVLGNDMADTLTDAILAYTDAHPAADGVHRTEIPGLCLVRGGRETSLQHAFYDPALIVVVQGSKELMLGDARFTYAAGQYLAMSVGLPVLASITEASNDRPYLALLLTLDLRVINDLMDEIGRVHDSTPAPSRLGLFVGTLDTHQADAIARLAALLATPDAMRVLHRSIVREIFYWTLMGRGGADIRRLAATNSHTQSIAKAINVMRAEFTDGVSVERLASIANMSPSSFHHHFKAVTSMSPLQYQKQLRLLEARRLMLAGGADAARAAYEVGYESASHFSREYARMFGAPPGRDVAAVRMAAS